MPSANQLFYNMFFMKIKYTILHLFLFLSVITYTNFSTIHAEPSSTVARIYSEQSPTERFLSTHSYGSIKYALNNYLLSAKDEALFNQLIKNENSSFIGYHASSTDFAIFQDIIKCTIEEVMKISIPKDFHFFRNPLDSNLIYETAHDFNKNIPIPNFGYDDTPSIRQHILSLNIALYQSYDAPWDLTPRYYLQNQTWTKPIYEDLLKNFFSDVGLNPKSVSSIYAKARSNYLPFERGILYQFFIKDQEYSLINTYFYVAESGGTHISNLSPTDVLFDYSRHTFPQMRMVLNVKSTLNPFFKIMMRRSDNLTSSQRKKYDNLLRSEIKKLPVESNKLLQSKEKLLQLWSS